MGLGLGLPELIIILVIVTMFFGVGRLPEVFRSAGQGLREFRREATKLDDDSDDEPVKKSSVAAPPAPADAPAAPSTNDELMTPKN